MQTPLVQTDHYCPLRPLLSTTVHSPPTERVGGEWTLVGRQRAARWRPTNFFHMGIEIQDGCLADILGIGRP